MDRQDFRLAPYPGLPYPEGVGISGTVARDGATLHLAWHLEAPDGAVAIPTPAARPQRRRELWEATCFEFFLASPDRPGYWEFNLSPSGDWNVFRFDSYRSGMTDDQAFDALLFTVAGRAGACDASASIDLARLDCSAAPWHLAVSTVVAEPDGRVSYWALAHPGPQPDFHDSAAFQIRM